MYLMRVSLMFQFAAVFIAPTAASQSLTIASISSTQQQSNHDSVQSSISQDGRYVAFQSEATNLVPGDINGALDIFVRDLKLGTTELASVTSSGAQPNLNSATPLVSADGRFVFFVSNATNMIPFDQSGGSEDIYMRDRRLGTTTVESIGATGIQVAAPSDQPAISSDARFLAFRSSGGGVVSGDTNSKDDIFVRDRRNATTTRASISSHGVQGDGHSSYPSISDDGRYVAYESLATNLVLGDTNGVSDIFVTDLVAGNTFSPTVSALVVGNGSSGRPSVSSDGRFIAFHSAASNLVPGDTNAYIDCFVYDRQTSLILRVSLQDDGAQAGDDCEFPVISRNGRAVLFTSDAVLDGFSGGSNGLKQAYVRDLSVGATVCVSRGIGSPNGAAFGQALNFRGDAGTFSSNSSDIVPVDMNGRHDVFVFN